MLPDLGILPSDPQDVKQIACISKHGIKAQERLAKYIFAAKEIPIFWYWGAASYDVHMNDLSIRWYAELIA